MKPEAAAALLEYQADAALRNEEGQTALEVAEAKGSDAVALLLLRDHSAGAAAAAISSDEYSSSKEEEDPLATLGYHKKWEMEAGLADGRNPNDPAEFRNGTPPLSAAAANDAPDSTLEALRKAGADVAAVDDNGMTALQVGRPWAVTRAWSGRWPATTARASTPRTSTASRPSTSPPP